MYAELGSGGGRTGGERTSVVESHYREALHYDDVKKLGSWSDTICFTHLLNLKKVILAVSRF